MFVSGVDWLDRLQLRLEKYSQLKEEDVADCFNRGVVTGIKSTLIDLQKEIETYKDMPRPFLQISQFEKAVVLYCDEELFAFVRSMEKEKKKEFSIADLGRVYVQIKKIFERGVVDVQTKKEKANEQA